MVQTRESILSEVVDLSLALNSESQPALAPRLIRTYTKPALTKMHRAASNQLAKPSWEKGAGLSLVLSPFNMAVVRFCFFFKKYQRMAKRWTATSKIMKVLPKPLCQEVARLTVLCETRLAKGPTLKISSSLKSPVPT